MGVTEEVKADGHRYEVNTNARGGRLGQETLSRPSGHRVIRHYSASPKLAQASPPPNDFGRQGDINGGDFQDENADGLGFFGQ
jgi:hypothetical protein